MKLRVFYPLLLAAFPVLFLYSVNMEEAAIADVPLPMLVLVIGTLTFMVLMRIFVKNWNKIALITTSLLILSFLYVPIRSLLQFWIIAGSLYKTILWGCLWLLLYAAIAFLILRSHRSFSIVTKFLSVTTVALIIISLVSIGVYQVGMPKSVSRGTSGELTYNGTPPDIYYIILDEYVRDDALKEIYDYDNKLTAYLISKGFYIASESCSNYWMSVPSMASALNMEYIDEAKYGYGEKLEMLQNSKVSQLLKSIGYHYIFVTSGALEKGVERYAELCISQQDIFGIKISKFAIYLIQITPLRPFTLEFVGHDWREGILYCFDEIARIPDIEAPTFTFAHIVCPHTPFVFDRKGNPIEYLGILPLEEHRKQYLDQLIFLNKKVESLVEEILLNSSIPPIIILQGDHGLRHHDEDRKWKYAILNAYHLPDRGTQLLYPTIYPINSFRVIFNYYFGTDYELLEDKVQP